MSKEKKKRKASTLFWVGFLSGPIFLIFLFSSQSFELLRDALGNTLPLFFTPGILEISLFFIGFSIVIIVNHLRRREQDDEWVIIESSENDLSNDKHNSS